MSDMPKGIYRSGDSWEFIYGYPLPAHPVVGDMVTADNETIVWDGEIWVALADFLLTREQPGHDPT